MDSTTHNAMVSTLMSEMEGLTSTIEQLLLRFDNARKLMEAILVDDSFPEHQQKKEKKPCRQTAGKIGDDSFMNSRGETFTLGEMVEASVPKKGYTGEDDMIGEILGITEMRVKIDLGAKKPAMRAFDNVRKVEEKYGTTMDEGMDMDRKKTD